MDVECKPCETNVTALQITLTKSAPLLHELDVNGIAHIHGALADFEGTACQTSYGVDAKRLDIILSDHQSLAHVQDQATSND